MKTKWYSHSVENICQMLSSTVAGLTSEEAQRRLRRYDYNRLPQAARHSAWRRFFHQFHNLLIYILLAAALITLILAKYIDMSVILAVVLINALIGFIQEGRAERAIEAVSQLLSATATVIRDGKRLELHAEEIVPGDVVLLRSGDKVPADIRLFDCKGLEISEALLTGESAPVAKTTALITGSPIINDQHNMAFSGTLVTSGQGMGIVVATGVQTEIGHISHLLTTVTELTTPLLRKMAVFSRWLSLAIVLVAAVVFLFGVMVHGYSFEVMLMAAVGIVVAAIPEGLPIIMTITLAIGVQRMARRHAIIRRLPAVETLGSVDIICSDKTGTLTKNEMMVQCLLLPNTLLNVTGSGYTRSGDFFKLAERIVPASEPGLIALSRAVLLCNDASFRLDGEQWILQGDPTEGALLTMALKAGLDQQQEVADYPLLDTIPFDSHYAFMATLHHDRQGHHIVFLKGAPEVVGPRCLGKAEWQQQVDNFASQGLRTLAVARQSVAASIRQLSPEEVAHGFEFLGLVGIIDPPRDEAVSSVAQCLQAGIKVKMITGDHAITAQAIAKQIGLDATQVLTGTELDALSADQLTDKVESVDVFARTSPLHKLKLVEALQQMGHIVAMTGDGVNDAPALKRADIGVAMGRKGTEAARESAEMVLTDDNFASIVEAVKQGRTVYDNLKKVIMFLLPINGGEAMSVMLAILLGTTLPISPLQILWVNMVSSVALAMALAFEPTEKSVMQRLPTPMHERLLSGLLLWRIVFVSAVFLGGIFALFFYAKSLQLPLSVARTLAVNGLVMLEIMYLFSSRYLHGSSLTWEGMRGTKAILWAIALVIVLQAFFTYAPIMQSIFRSSAVSLQQAIWVILIGVIGFTVLEIEKLIGLALKLHDKRRSISASSSQ